MKYSRRKSLKRFQPSSWIKSTSQDKLGGDLQCYQKYYPNASDDELKDIQEVVYLLACAVMQQFYGPEWMGGFEEPEQEGK